ncbi:alpha/beta hydrolase [Microbacteriaceae bacterium VKM Ac-2854]|nr:alpha/beta hydrolase [Microbacteriaceae bacterium VKM Ac-2854]
MARRPRSRSVRIVRAVGFSALGAFALAIVGFLIWSQMVMAAEPGPLAAVTADPAIAVTESDSAVVMTPTGDSSGAGLVFIPGAKVDPHAYESVLAPLVEAGGTVVITKPILNLAFFDLRGLDTFTDQAGEVSTWYVGGHSLGGVKACQLASEADGLVLFGSYCANDLSDSGLRVLSIGGSEDGLSTPAKIDAAKGELPADAVFVQIEGSNHAEFGSYGAQPGDGVATISEAEAHEQIADALLTYFPRAIID